MKNLKDHRFGRLVALHCAYVNQHRQAVWLCQCDCGQTVFVVGSDLSRGHTVSCGCFNREQSRKANTRHGGRKSRLYSIWRGMRQRCQNPRHKDFARYGGRGITVAPEWNSFPVFRAWAMSCGYAEDLTIERRDVNGDYSPDNCIWASLEEQAQNKRDTYRVAGMSLKKYCRQHGLPYGKVLSLVHKMESK